MNLIGVWIYVGAWRVLRMSGRACWELSLARDCCCDRIHLCCNVSIIAMLFRATGDILVTTCDVWQDYPLGIRAILYFFFLLDILLHMPRGG